MRFILCRLLFDFFAIQIEKELKKAFVVLIEKGFFLFCRLYNWFLRFALIYTLPNRLFLKSFEIKKKIWIGRKFKKLFQWTYFYDSNFYNPSHFKIVRWIIWRKEKRQIRKKCLLSLKPLFEIWNYWFIKSWIYQKFVIA